MSEPYTWLVIDANKAGKVLSMILELTFQEYHRSGRYP